MNKTTLALIAFTCSLLSGFIGFSTQYFTPKIKPLIVKEIHNKTKDFIDINLKAEDIEFDWLSLAANFNNLYIQPKKDLKKYLGPVDIKNIEVSLNFIELLKGNVSIKSIDIVESNVTVIVKKFSNNQKKQIDSLDILKKIPIEFLNLNQVNLLLKISPLNISLFAKNIDAQFENLKSALISKVNSEEIILKKSDDIHKYKFSLDSNILLENQRILISNFSFIQNKNFYLDLSGDIKGKWLNNSISQININSDGKLDMKLVSGISQELFPNLKLPNIGGIVKYSVKQFGDKLSFKSPKFVVESDELTVAGQSLKKLSVKGKLSDDELKIYDLNVSNSVGNITDSRVGINIKKMNNINANLNVNQFNLDNLLNALSTKKSKKQPEVTAQVLANGQAQCTGSIKPKFKITCNTKAYDSKFHLIRNSEKNNIIEINNIAGKSSVIITDTFVAYDGMVSVNTSDIAAKGQVNYSTGFYIDLNGNIKDIKNDIKNIANLDLEGDLKGTGRIEGNSRTATFTSQVVCASCVIKKWKLGDFSADFSLIKSNLLFDNIKGRLGESQHSSRVNVDLLNSTIDVDSDFQKVELSDVRKAIYENVKIDFKIEGEGTAKVKLWGPLVLNELNFDFISSFGYGFVTKESFDRAKIDLTCRNGNIKVKKVNIKKADSTIVVNGGMDREANIDITAFTQSLLIKNSEFLNMLKVDLGGSLNISSRLTGTFKDPKVTVDGYIYNDELGLVNNKNSSINLIIDREKIYGKLTLNKDQFIGEIDYPFTNKDALVALDAKNWNFSKILEGHFPHLKKLNIFSNVNGSAKLRLPNKNFYRSTGSVNFSNFHMLRGSYSLYLAKKIAININNGNISDFSTKFKGQRSNLDIQSKGSSFNDLNLNLNGKIDLGLGLILSSIIEEFKGNTSLSLNVTGPIHKPSTNGSVYVQDATLKILELKQPITNLNAELTMNNQDLIINQMNGIIGDGNIILNGKIGLSKVEPNLKINGYFKDVQFKSIDGVNLLLNGDYKLTGQQTPYLLAANVDVLSGNIDKEVTLNKTTKQKKLSKFAPEEFQEKKTNPFLLNVNLNFERDIPTKIVTTQVTLETIVFGQLNISDKISDPIFNGKINFAQNGRLILRNNEYVIRNSSLSYRDQKAGNPYLNLEADGRVEEYDISIKVLGTGENPNISFQSSPILANNEIINLILLGYTTTEIDNETGPQDQNNRLAFEASSIILKEKLGLTRGLNDKLGIDVDISSTFNEDQSKAIPVVTLKKRLGKKLNASASRTFEKSATNSVKLDYKLNKNLSIIGSYVREEGKDTTNDTDEDGDALGLDFEYKLEFK